MNVTPDRCSPTLLYVLQSGQRLLWKHVSLSPPCFISSGEVLFVLLLPIANEPYFSHQLLLHQESWQTTIFKLSHGLLVIVDSLASIQLPEGKGSGKTSSALAKIILQLDMRKNLGLMTFILVTFTSRQLSVWKAEQDIRVRSGGNIVISSPCP